jgi:uncharacterized protein
LLGRRQHPADLGLASIGRLTNQEIEELDAFLLSDDGRENAMDVSVVDGFLCAVLSTARLLRNTVRDQKDWKTVAFKQFHFF